MVVLHRLLEENAFFIGTFLRLFLAWLLPWLFDVQGVVPGVAYTDIDYHIFVDAANHIKQGNSPYQRHTYRYTPFLAYILSKFPNDEVARYLFCIADAICGWIILKYRQQKRQENKTQEHESSKGTSIISPKLQDALWWLYNPLAINICTRGSSESFQVLLPVLLTVTTVTTGNKTCSRALLAGIWHGIAVHSKLYPIIYSLSFMTYFAPSIQKINDSIRQQSTLVGKLFSFVLSWAKRLLRPAPVLFFVAFAATFAVLTYLSVHWYGQTALEEGLLYHFSRVDHRHNYSMHWYWIYLGRARADFSQNMALLGKLLLLPQLVLLVYTSLTVAPYNLGLALFLQTYLFVTQNKVITAQYLTWYLCLLPLCSDSFRMTRQLILSLLGLGLSYAFWLSSAYRLEMQGKPVHRIVWVASAVYYWANISVIGALLGSHQGEKITTKAVKERIEKEKVVAKQD